VLEVFMKIGQTYNRTPAWAVRIHKAFIVSGVQLAIMGRLSVTAYK